MKRCQLCEGAAGIKNTDSYAIGPTDKSPLYYTELKEIDATENTALKSDVTVKFFGRNVLETL